MTLTRFVAISDRIQLSSQMAMHMATAAAPCAGRVFARLAHASGAQRRHVAAQSARVPRRARESARVSATATAEATAEASTESEPADLANAREVESAEGLRIVRSGVEGGDDAFVARVPSTRQGSG